MLMVARSPKKPSPDPTTDAARRILREVRKAETAALASARQTIKGEVEDAGTGFTIIKLSASPIRRLLERGRIGAEELRAAEEIVLAFQSMTSALWVRPQTLERRDRSYHGNYEPAAVVDAMARYKAFAAHWSTQARHGCPLLAILIEAIVDERGLREIEADRRLRNGRASQIVVGGLRDYAARSGWVTGGIATSWFEQAAGLFSSTALRLAVHRGKVEA